MPSWLLLFQSTLLHKERQEQLRSLTNATGISIHAPTQGATKLVKTGTAAAADFNPRSYTRSDINADLLVESSKISIHAPTQGATR